MVKSNQWRLPSQSTPLMNELNYTINMFFRGDPLVQTQFDNS